MHRGTGKIFTKILTMFLIVALSLVSLVPQQVLAQAGGGSGSGSSGGGSVFSGQVNNGGFVNTGGGGGGGNGGFNIQGAGAAALAQCVATLITAFVAAEAVKVGAVTVDTAKDAADAAAATATAAGSTATPLKVQDISANASLLILVADKKIQKKADIADAADTKDTNIQSRWQVVKEQCLDGIAKAVAVAMIDKITLATVDWINSGFRGDPLYLSNTEEFFTDIFIKEVEGIKNWYGTDPTKFPFGQILMESLFGDIKRTAQQNMEFSLHQVLAHGTPEQFRVNFAVGGWLGYAASYDSQNNPYGSYLELSDQVARRTRGTSTNYALDLRNQLQVSGGFLNQSECSATQSGHPGDQWYSNETNPPHPLYVGNLAPITKGKWITPDVEVQLSADVLAFIDSQNPEPFSGAPQEDFDQWEHDKAATLNTMIAQSICAKWRTLTPGNVIAEQIKYGTTSIFRQLEVTDELNESLALIMDALINQMIQQGVAGAGQVLTAQVNGEYPGQQQYQDSVQDTILGTTNPGTGVVIQPSLFNIQNGYVVVAQNNVLPAIEQGITRIHSLDYCVPGPNPNWVLDSAGGILDLVATVPVFVSQNSNQTQAAQENEQYYHDAIQDLTDISVDMGPEIDDHFEFTNFMENLMTVYANALLGEYSPTQPPPTSRFVLANLWPALTAYEVEVDTINNQVASIQANLPILQQIQSALGALAAANGGVLDQNDPAVQTQVNLFNQISVNLVTPQQLNDLISRETALLATLNVYGSFINNCLDETVNNPYSSPNQRLEYPFPVVVNPALPPQDNTFLPGVGFGTGTGDLDVEFAGITIDQGTNNTDLFESLLEVLY